jgi:LmbE family N-acetylglucosaminyl deacetylase
MKMIALAAAAHPDDIEFMMAGTLLRLKQAGAEIHMWNLANGSCGTVQDSREEIVRRRTQEAQNSARIAGATMHPPLFDDLQILYDADSLARVAAIVREIRPNILLIPSPQDYMEDHQNACRLLVSGAFVRGMRNFSPRPPRPAWDGPVALYHALPHGLRDGLRRLVQPGYYVDTGPVFATKREMLAQHQSQKQWLDVSQGIDAYLGEMEAISRQVGRMSGRFEYAEGWRRHAHLGFSPPDYDPLAARLGAACWIDPNYEAALG